MEKPEKICANCRYFFQHYIKRRSTLYRVHCGFCAKRTLTAKEKRRFPSIHDCSEWEPMEIQLDERRQNIIDTLHDMSEQLKAISAILLDDEEIRKQLNI